MTYHKTLFNWIKIPLLIIFIFVIQRLCHHATGGFTIGKITSSHPFNPAWEISLKDPLILDSILNQQFTFFKYGGQSYVFLSEDGKIVLKVFKHHHMRIPSWFKQLPVPKKWKRFHHRYIKNQESKLPSFFTSCIIAHEQFKERTGLLYLHLNQTSHLNKKLILIDKLNISHTLDLDTLDFAIQHRAVLPQDHFRQLAKENNIVAAQESIDSLLNLIIERGKKGILDRDPCIRRNCGFIGNTAVDIDLGSYIEDSSAKFPFMIQSELYYRTIKFQKWLENHYPQAAAYLDTQLKKQYESSFLD